MRFYSSFIASGTKDQTAQCSRKIGLAILAVTLRDVSACILTPATTASAGKEIWPPSSPPSSHSSMYIVQPHELHETDTKSMNTPCERHIRDRPGAFVMGLQRPAILLAFSALRLPQVCATPIEMASFKRRNGDNTPSSVNPKIYVRQSHHRPSSWLIYQLVVTNQVPIAVFLIISFVLVILSKKTNLRRALSGFALTGAAPSAGLGRPTPTGAPRVVTAEQLAGTINGEGAGTTAPTTTRRARRPRRTPSQMSVTSLPAYNKEPGDEELVIFR